MISARTLLKGLTRKHRCALAFCLALTLVAVQITGLHFHVHQVSVGPASMTAPVVHAAHSDVHDACHESGCGIDVPMTEFWKSPDQGWNVLALFTAICVLLLSIRSRGMPYSTRTGKLPDSHPVFLRPPLRAPPF